MVSRYAIIVTCTASSIGCPKTHYKIRGVEILLKNNNILINLPIIFVLGLLPIIINPLSYDYYYGIKALLLVVISLSCIIIMLINIGKLKPFSSRNLYAAIGCASLSIYMLLVVLSTFMSIDINRSIWGRPLRWEGLIILICYSIVFYYSKVMPLNKNLLIKVFCLASFAIALYGILQHFGIDPLPRDIFRRNWINYSYGTSGNPDFLGSLIVLSSPFALYIFLRENKYIYLIIFLIQFICLIFTRSRGPFIGFTVSLLILFCYIIRDSYFRKRILSSLALIIILFTIINITSDNIYFKRVMTIPKNAFSIITAQKNNDYAGSGRIYIWKKTLQLIKARPMIGYGPDTFDLSYMSKFGKESISHLGPIIEDKAHNEYLQIAYASGLPALISYLMFILASIYIGINNMNKENLSLPLAAGCAGYLVQAFFNISVVSVAPVFWVLLGITASNGSKISN